MDVENLELTENKTSIKPITASNMSIWEALGSNIIGAYHIKQHFNLERNK